MNILNLIPKLTKTSHIQQRNTTVHFSDALKMHQLVVA